MNPRNVYIEGESSKWYVGAAKENDLRPISDRISGTMRRFLLEDLRDREGIKAQSNQTCMLAVGTLRPRK